MATLKHEGTLAVVEGPAGEYSAAVKLDKARYVQVRGLELTFAEGASPNGVGVGGEYGDHLVIADCRIHGCGQGGVSLMRCAVVTIENNRVWDNSATGIWQGSGISLYQQWDWPSTLPKGPRDPRDYQNVIRGNACWNNRNEVPNHQGKRTDGNGIIVDDLRQTQDFNPQDPNPRKNQPQYGGVRVENNVCFNNGGRGIHSFLSSNVFIVNNSCALNGWDAEVGGAELSSGWSDGVVFRNNAVLARPNGLALWMMRDRDGGPLPVVDHNVLSGRVESLNETYALPPSNLVADPAFINPAHGDVRLRSTSPAVGFGLRSGAPSVDRQGRRRAGKVDAGAFQRSRG